MCRWAPHDRGLRISGGWYVRPRRVSRRRDRRMRPTAIEFTFGAYRRARRCGPATPSWARWTAAPRHLLEGPLDGLAGGGNRISGRGSLGRGRGRQTAATDEQAPFAQTPRSAFWSTASRRLFSPPDRALCSGSSRVHLPRRLRHHYWFRSFRGGVLSGQFDVDFPRDLSSLSTGAGDGCGYMVRRVMCFGLDAC